MGQEPRFRVRFVTGFVFRSEIWTRQDSMIFVRIKDFNTLPLIETPPQSYLQGLFILCF